MEIIQAIILGLLQGITEFIPVSSSGHLVLVPWLMGWDAPGLVFDTVVHWGTLLAVLAYFWRYRSRKICPPHEKVELRLSPNMLLKDPA